MKIPATVKIGWRIYTIQIFTDEKRDETGELLDGYIDFTNHIIYINRNLNEDEQKVVFIHEMQHGIFYGQCHPEWGDNENLVDACAEGWFQVTKDNPKLFA